MNSGRRFVIGDIHGANLALIQCLEKSAFNPQHDLLISLGDLCDRWPEVNKVFDTLLGIKNLVLLLGNHDQWALEWFLRRRAPEIWLMQGGNITVGAYKQGVPESHIALLKQAALFYELDNKLFVHGGYNPEKDIHFQDREVLLWDRSLIKSALKHLHNGDEIHLTRYDEVYVGHTPTLNFGETVPIKACEVYLMDTGAGWPGGVLTIMDLDSKEYFQSDPVDRLYGEA
jgi:serine/threonine protein phosphatase 1